MEENQNNEQPEVVTNGTPKADKKKYNISSLVLGIIAILGSCVWYINFPCSIMAIIFSVVGKHSDGRGMGIAGMVLGIIAMVIYVVIIVLAVLGIAALAGSGALNELSTYGY